MLYTGMRVGEALGLRIEDIDFEKKELYIRRTVGFTGKPGAAISFFEHEPKTLSGKRTIPLFEQAAELLKIQINKRNMLV